MMIWLRREKRERRQRQKRKQAAEAEVGAEVGGANQNGPFHHDNMNAHEKKGPIDLHVSLVNGKCMLIVAVLQRIGRDERHCAQG